MTARPLELLPSGVPVLCTTATANDRVIEDIQAQLGAELEDALIANEVKALVATSALGMGFEKPDLGYMIHR